MVILKIALHTLSASMLAMVFLPLFKKDYWLFRIFDYPRLQKFVLIVLLLAGWMFVVDWNGNLLEMAVVALLGVSALHLAYLIYPFTPVSQKMIGKASNSDTKESLCILVSNVYQHNRNYQKLLNLVRHKKPDIVFLVEVDKAWVENMEELRREFPQYVEVPKDNTYGLAFYSRLPMISHQVNYLIDEEVPSVVAEINLYGTPIKIFGLHPTPPVPQENEHSTDRDAEILLIGKQVKKEKVPCMVIGDMNDVAWSYTTELFLKTSGLLDPRHGRGLYSTFHSKYPLMRWPLDHFFVSSDFGLIDMHVEHNIGSDHFPISIKVALSDNADAHEMSADSDDKELATEKIEAGLADEPR